MLMYGEWMMNRCSPWMKFHKEWIAEDPVNRKVVGEWGKVKPF